MPTIRDSVDPAAAKVAEDEERLASSTADIKDNSLSTPWRLAPALGHAADALSTMEFRKHGGQERGAAAIIGKEPSTAAVLGLKAGSALLSDIGLRALAKKSPTAAKILSAGLTGRLAMTAKGNLDYAKKKKSEKKMSGR